MKTLELDSFEETLQNGLVRLCTSGGYLDNEMLSSPDIDAKWDEYIQQYVGDAINNMDEYPQAAMAWAAFLGMGVAWNWDHDWIVGSHLPYAAYYGEENWDDMDENILYNILGYERDSKEVKNLIDMMLSCADASMALLNRSGIELDTEEGFYAVVRCYGALFRIGAAIILKQCGYKKVPVKFS